MASRPTLRRHGATAWGTSARPCSWRPGFANHEVASRRPRSLAAAFSGSASRRLTATRDTLIASSGWGRRLVPDTNPFVPERAVEEEEPRAARYATSTERLANDRDAFVDVA